MKENLLPSAEETKLLDPLAEERPTDELKSRPPAPHPPHISTGKIMLATILLIAVVVAVALAGYLAGVGTYLILM